MDMPLKEVVSKQHIGDPRRRHEDPRLLSGKGYYAADLSYPGALVAATLRSPFAHALILSINASAARDLEGVIAIYTAADIGIAQRPLPSFGQFPKSLVEHWKPTIRACPHPTLAEGKVRYVGQPVAFVVAESREIAEDALDLIEVDYDVLPPVMSVDAAQMDGVTRLFEEHPDNVALDLHAHVGDVDAAFANATHIVRDEFEIQRYTGMALEGRGILAVPTQTGLNVWAGHQLPHFLRILIADALAVPQFEIRVMQSDIGGGFGPKAGMYSEDVLVPYAAKRLNRPVKWVEDKREQLIASSHSRQQSYSIELALDESGKFLGLRYHARIDTGAYLTFPVVLSYLGMCHFLGPYTLPAMGAHVQSILTNKTQSAPARGAGRPEVVFALNRIVDRAAQHLGMDPMAIRRMNFIQPHELPMDPGILYRDGNPMQIDSGNYPEALEQALSAIGYDAFREEQKKARGAGRHVGIGVSCNIEAGGLGPYEYARVKVDPSGKVIVYVGVSDTGQGHKTSLAQVCADALGAEPEDIIVMPADTDTLPYGRGTYHSRAAVAAGNAVYMAAKAAHEKALSIAACELDVDLATLEFINGAFHDPSSGRSLTLAACARLAAPESALGARREPGLDETACFEIPTTSWGNAVHAAIVEVDAETGAVAIKRYVVVHDCGRMLNPLIVEGQTVGAIAQGIGGTFLENLVYDEDGNPLSTTLQDYLMPRLSDVPHIEIIHMESPSPLNPLGVKGAGEAGTIGPPATLAAAVEDALGPFGVRINATPLSPSTVLAALRKSKETQVATR